MYVGAKMYICNDFAMKQLIFALYQEYFRQKLFGRHLT